MPRPDVDRSTKLAYGIGAVAYGVKDNGFAFFLLLYYNQVLGLPETWVGVGILIALVLDALSDPLVGHLSDHLHSRWGRRHPFMYAAALPVAASYVLLWCPPTGLSDGALFAYFVVAAVLVRTCITFYEIPSTSLVAELTLHYDERTSLLGYRYFFAWWGGLGMAVLAYGVFLQPDATQPVGVLNAEGYRAYGVAASGIMLVGILVSSLGTHRYIPRLQPTPPRRPSTMGEAAAELRQTLANPSFRALFLSAIFGAMATGLTAALNVYFYTYFWELTSSQIFVLICLHFGSAAIALGLAPACSRRWGKKRAAVGVALTAVTLAPLPIGLRLLGLFPANHTPALLPTLAVFGVVEVTLLISANILLSAMMADVVEDSALATGRRSEGIFFAARSFIAKAVSGIGVLASAVLLVTVGFPRGAAPGTVDPAVIRQLGLVYAPTVVALYLASVGVLLRYRITRAGHEENLRRLAEATAP